MAAARIIHGGSSLVILLLVGLTTVSAEPLESVESLDNVLQKKSARRQTRTSRSDPRCQVPSAVLSRTGAKIGQEGKKTAQTRPCGPIKQGAPVHGHFNGFIDSKTAGACRALCAHTIGCTAWQYDTTEPTPCALQWYAGSGVVVKNSSSAMSGSCCTAEVLAELNSGDRTGTGSGMEALRPKQCDKVTGGEEVNANPDLHALLLHSVTKEACRAVCESVSWCNAWYSSRATDSGEGDTRDSDWDCRIMQEVGEHHKTDPEHMWGTCSQLDS